MEEKRVQETTTNTAGKRPHVEGRRRTISKDHPKQSWKRVQVGMETPQV